MMTLFVSRARPRGSTPRGRAGQITERLYPRSDPARKCITPLFTRAGGGFVADEDVKKKVSRVTGNFNQVARDLDRALAAARFAPAQVLLMQQAREESYTRAKLRGMTEPLPFKLNLSGL